MKDLLVLDIAKVINGSLDPHLTNLWLLKPLEDCEIANLERRASQPAVGLLESQQCAGPATVEVEGHDSHAHQTS